MDPVFSNKLYYHLFGEFAFGKLNLKLAYKSLYEACFFQSAIIYLYFLAVALTPWETG